MRERHLFSVAFNGFTHGRAFFPHLLSGLKSGSPHEHYLLLLFFPSFPTVPHPSVFHLSPFSGNFYSSPWFWVSLLSLLMLQKPLHSPPNPPLDYPSPHHSLKMPGWLLLPLSHLHRLLSACSPCPIPPRNSAHLSLITVNDTKDPLGDSSQNWNSISSLFLLFVQSWSSACAMGLLSRPWLVSLLSFFFFSSSVPSANHSRIR